MHTIAVRCSSIAPCCFGGGGGRIRNSFPLSCRVSRPRVKQYCPSTWMRGPVWRLQHCTLSVIIPMPVPHDASNAGRGLEATKIVRRGGRQAGWGSIAGPRQQQPRQAGKARIDLSCKPRIVARRDKHLSTTENKQTLRGHCAMRAVAANIFRDCFWLFWPLAFAIAAQPDLTPSKAECSKAVGMSKSGN